VNYLLLELFPVKTYLKHPEMKNNLPKYLQTHTWTPPKNGCQMDEGGTFSMQQFSGAFFGPNRYTSQRVNAKVVESLKIAMSNVPVGLHPSWVSKDVTR